ncbi:MAG: CotH kinase family protein, partial [Spirochaetota bacterium]
TTVEVAFHFSELRGMAEGGLDRFGTLEPGETGYLRWQYSNHHLTEGSVRSALALNNIIVEPILTPPRDADRGASEPLGAIALSRSAGFYDEPFDLELSTSLPEARIYYTVDGSRPDPDAVMSDTQWADLPIETRRRTFEYRRPIDLAALEQRENDVATIPTSVRDSDPVWIPPETRLPKAATVRAVAIGAQSRSAVRTATFLFAPSGETHHELPVWSIQTDRGSFFDPDSGIYVPGPDAPEVNYFRRGSDWEAQAHVEFFEDDRRRVLAQQMGIRIHGNYTRTYPQKSLRLYSRTDYGPGRMSHRFFESKEIDDFNRLLLRNGGNDFSGGLLSDPVAQTLVEHLAFDTQHYRPSVVYLNGEYWGIHNMRDRYDQHYLETHYGIPRDEVLILEGEGVVDTGAQQTVGEIYDPFVDFRERVASGEIADWEALDEEMALSEYIDYVFVQVYAGNYDWPQNNIRYWRYAGPNPTAERGPRDGRWRWMLYDVDFAFGHQFSTTFDMVEWSFGFTEEHPFLEEWRREQYQDRFEINQRIAEVTEIRQELLQRFAVHLATTASERRALEFVNRHAARIESEMRRQIARWSYPKSMDAWYAVVETMRDFARRRPQIVRDHLLRFFDDVTGFAELSVAGITDSSGLSLHTIDLDDRTEGVEIEDGRWSGMLFTGIPVTIESSRSDLRDATFEPDERVQIIERSQQRLSFYLNGNAGITLSTESQ